MLWTEWIVSLQNSYIEVLTSPMTSSNPNYFPEAHVHMPLRWGLRLTHMNFRGTQFNPQQMLFLCLKLSSLNLITFAHHPNPLVIPHIRTRVDLLKMVCCPVSAPHSVATSSSSKTVWLFTALVLWSSNIAQTYSIIFCGLFPSIPQRIFHCFVFIPF